jgi:hypothetical protein
MPDLGKKGDKMPELAFSGPLYYKNAIKYVSYVALELLFLLIMKCRMDLDLREPENPNHSNYITYML